MTVFSSTYDKATPTGADDPVEGDDRIRETKAAIQERENVDHYWPLTGTEVSDVDAGEHRKVTLRVGSAPTAVANKGFVYAKDVAGKAELFYRDEDGNEVQLTSAGKIANVVLLTTAQAIAGVKTFSSSPIVPNLSASNNSTKSANTKYVDDAISAAIAAIPSTVFGDSTGTDSGSNVFLKAHAYSAPTDGIVTAWSSGAAAVGNVSGYVGNTDNPAGAGVKEAQSTTFEGGMFISFPVPKGKFWEITSDKTIAGIRWRAFGTLIKPVDQD